jgi:hypothetical protein
VSEGRKEGRKKGEIEGEEERTREREREKKKERKRLRSPEIESSVNCRKPNNSSYCIACIWDLAGTLHSLERPEASGGSWKPPSYVRLPGSNR